MSKLVDTAQLKKGEMDMDPAEYNRTVSDYVRTRSRFETEGATVTQIKEAIADYYDSRQWE